MANFPDGVMSDAQIGAMIDSGAISAERPLLAGQIQPASLDLRLGQTAYRVRASFLAGRGKTVMNDTIVGL